MIVNINGKDYVDADELRNAYDLCIRFWRDKKNAADGEEFEEHFRTIAECYIDAFQAMRWEIFGKTLD